MLTQSQVRQPAREGRAPPTCHPSARLAFLHRKRRKAGYDLRACAPRTHGRAGAGAWDNKMHRKPREAALPHVDETATSLPDTCETDMQPTQTRRRASATRG